MMRDIAENVFQKGMTAKLKHQLGIAPSAVSILEPYGLDTEMGELFLS
jgi:hypothetical protein